MFYRSDNRSTDQLRPVSILPDFITTAEGSVLIEVGNTRVICTASIEETVPPFLRNSGKGWISSEYAMIPRATLTRSPRGSGEGTGERADARNPAADWAVAACGDRLGAIGRAHDMD